MSYQEEYQQSIKQPGKFWQQQAKQLDWFTFPKKYPE